MRITWNRENDPDRQKFHLMPLTGMLADPNGVCQVDDIYHIYYIVQPEAFTIAERTPYVWAHYATSDFIHYMVYPTAIHPDHPRDRSGIFSGCVVREDERLYAIYTGNVRHPGDYDYIHDGREQNILKIESDDCIHFDHKVVLMTNRDFPPDMTRHVRDPQITKTDDHYTMVLGARSQDDVGWLLVYGSEDLTHFTLEKRLTTPETFGYMWECPEWLAMNGQTFLICCPQGVPYTPHRYENPHQCGYFLMAGDHFGAFTTFDYGFDFYAARTFEDERGRRILQGWMGMSEAPYAPNRTKACNWDQCLAMPRLLEMKDGHLYQKPLPEFQKLRIAQETYEGGQRHFEADAYELCLTLTRPQDLEISFREDGLLSYHCDTHLVTLSFGACGGGRDSRTLILPEGLCELQIFGDVSSLEIFLNDGYATMTSRIFGENYTIDVGPLIGHLTFYRLGEFTLEVAE